MHDHHWTFGQHSHIRFPGGGDPVVDSNHGFGSYEGCACVSDAAGALLFYSDGTQLWDGAHNPVLSPPLGGSSSSTHSAIIVPPAGGGSLYHLFTTNDWDGSPPQDMGPVNHVRVSVSGGVSIVSGPTPLSFGPALAAEKLAAISHVECDKYWLVSAEIGSDEPPWGDGHTGDETDRAAGAQAAAGTQSTAAASRLHVMLIADDQGPLSSITYPFAAAGLRGWIRFSPDGALLAVTGHNTLELLSFDRATGAIAHHSRVTNWNAPYGLEFSPNGRYVYLSSHVTGEIRRHTIGSPNSSVAHSNLPLIAQLTQAGTNGYFTGALQLGPNGKIYGTKMSQPGLFEIGAPDHPTNVQFSPVATQAASAGGGPLNLNGNGELGLPSFTGIAADCRCDYLAAQVDAQIAGTPKVNTLRPCDKEQPVEKPPCRPIDLPKIAPWTSIRWGDSQCDCIEGDDTEVMHLTVCNPYRNLTLSNLTVHQLVVVDMNGNPPPLLPDGSPSIQLVPIGPYCFDDLEPCTCVTRQFVLRLRGAVPGPYRILVKGICFDACFHGDEEDCFVFNVCKD
jgi:hypothetical protein